MAIQIAAMVDETDAKPVKRARRAPQAPKSKLAKLQKPAETPVAIETQSEAQPAKVRHEGRGRPKTGKVIVTLRLDPEVVEALRADGPGWQPRANALLRAALKIS